MKSYALLFACTHCYTLRAQSDQSRQIVGPAAFTRFACRSLWRQTEPAGLCSGLAGASGKFGLFGLAVWCQPSDSIVTLAQRPGGVRVFHPIREAVPWPWPSIPKFSSDLWQFSRLQTWLKRRESTTDRECEVSSLPGHLPALEGGKL